MENKTKSMSDIQNLIKEVEDDLKNNWSAWEDASPSRRDYTIRKLKRIRLCLNKPLRIDIKVINLANRKGERKR